MAATRVRWALAALACAFAGVAALVLPLPFYPLDDSVAVLWIVGGAGLELLAAALGIRSLGSDPKGGPWRWLAVISVVIPLTLLLLILFWLGLIGLFVLGG